MSCSIVGAMTEFFRATIPADALIEGRGFRVSIVFENEPGHFPTGSWPYEGKPGQQAPWFWGEDYKIACQLADEQNEIMGISKLEAIKIVASSMAGPGRRRKGFDRRSSRL